MLHEMIGWTGTVLFIGSYTLLSIKKLKAGDLVYQLMNAAAGLCLVVNALHLKDMPTLVVNFLWMCISLYAMALTPKKRADV